MSLQVKEPNSLSKMDIHSFESVTIHRNLACPVTPHEQVKMSPEHSNLLEPLTELLAVVAATKTDSDALPSAPMVIGGQAGGEHDRCSSGRGDKCGASMTSQREVQHQGGATGKRSSTASASTKATSAGMGEVWMGSAAVCDMQRSILVAC